MKRIKYFLFIIVLAYNTFASCQPITVGLSKSLPPFSSIDASNHYFGFCVEIINEICKRLHETCQYRPVALGNQINELVKRNIDITFSPAPIPSIQPQDIL
jgi:ABC-type amino acid transport substrate-binding protein